MKKLLSPLLIVLFVASAFRPRPSFQATIIEDAQVFDVYHSEWVTVYAEQEVTVAAVVQNEGLKCFIQWRAPVPVNWRGGWTPCNNLDY